MQSVESELKPASGRTFA